MKASLCVHRLAVAALGRAVDHLQWSVDLVVPSAPFRTVITIARIHLTETIGLDTPRRNIITCDKENVILLHSMESEMARKPEAIEAEAAKLTRNEQLVLGVLMHAVAPKGAYAILNELRSRGFRSAMQVFCAGCTHG